MTDTLPYLTENLLHQLSPDQSFAHGMRIYNAGALYALERRESTFRGYCQMPGQETQSISVILEPQGIQSTACTCDHRGEGLCAHAVALLLAWIYQPEAFQVTAGAPLAELLAQRSKEELIEMIQEMLRYVPDLERVMGLVEPPPADAAPVADAAPAAQTLDLARFQARIDFITQRGYPETSAVAQELQVIADVAERFARDGDWVNAGKLHCLILAGIIPHYATLFDEGGQIARLLLISAERLSECLAYGEPDAPTHQTWIAALLLTEFTAIALGGVDLPTSAGLAVIARATDAEWAGVAQQVRDAIAQRRGDLTWIEREALLDLLVRRERATERHAEAEALLLELGSPRQRAFTLLGQGQSASAVEVARQFATMPDLAIQFADTLVDMGLGTEAEAYITSLEHTAGRTAYLKWLARYAEAEGHLEAAAERYEQSFWEIPTLRTYQALRRLGQRAQHWAQRYTALLEKLAARQQWALLLDIVLHEGDIARALALLKQLPPDEYVHYAQNVAQAAENDHPMEALNIYWQYVTAYVQAGGRDNYHQAVEYLLRIRALCRRFERLDVWEQYIQDIRTQYAHSAALQDELDKAGLG